MVKLGYSTVTLTGAALSWIINAPHHMYYMYMYPLKLYKCDKQYPLKLMDDQNLYLGKILVLN